MTPTEIIYVAKWYDDYLSINCDPNSCSGFTQGIQEAKSIKDGGTMRSHIRWMCEKAATFANEDIDKANRWLGFIQGYLWTNDDFTIDQMRDHNRS